MKIEDLKEYIGFGIAGNFANHLNQAGEEKDFINVAVDEENAPKGLFPFYVPNSDNFLNIFPLSDNSIKLPNIKGSLVQMEPEIALFCKIVYDDNNKVKVLLPEYFSAYNDCSIREPNAPKISQKKNWGLDSKGMSSQFIKIDNFSKGGLLDSYNIASFLKSNNEVKAYGEDSPCLTYNYFHEKLTTWMTDKLNTQENFGPLEKLSEQLEIASYPSNLIVNIGATSYTVFGENRFLKKNDEVFVCIYDNKKYSHEEILNSIEKENYILEGASILHQNII